MTCCLCLQASYSSYPSSGRRASGRQHQSRSTSAGERSSPKALSADSEGRVSGDTPTQSSSSSRGMGFTQHSCVLLRPTPHPSLSSLTPISPQSPPFPVSHLCPATRPHCNQPMHPVLSCNYHHTPPLPIHTQPRQCGCPPASCRDHDACQHAQGVGAAPGAAAVRVG